MQPLTIDPLNRVESVSEVKLELLTFGCSFSHASPGYPTRVVMSCGTLLLCWSRGLGRHLGKLGYWLPISLLGILRAGK